MRGRTNVGGGTGVISSTVISGVVKEGEHISAGNFVECVNQDVQLPLEISDRYNDPYLNNRFCFKLSDGRFIVFHGSKSSITLSTTSENIKFVSIISVNTTAPTIDLTQQLQFVSTRIASEILVCEVGTDTYIVGTMQVMNSQWVLCLHKCVVNVLTDQITFTDILTLDASSAFPSGTNLHYRTTYFAQNFGELALCSLENQKDVLVVYGEFCVIVDYVNNTSSQVIDLNIPFTVADSFEVSETASTDRKARYEMFMYASNKVLLKVNKSITATNYKEAVIYILTINNDTVIRSEGEIFDTYNFSRLYKIKTNLFVLADSSGEFIFITVDSNDQLQRNILEINFNDLIEENYGSIDTAITVYDVNTILVAVSSAVSRSYIKPLCVIGIDISDLSQAHVLFVREIIKVTSEVTRTNYHIFDGFIFDPTTLKGLFLYSNYSYTTAGSTTDRYNGELFCIGLNSINGVLFPCGLNPVFTKYVKSITGVSKTSGNSGDTIQVYIPDANT